MSTVEISEQESWSAHVLELPGASSRAELLSAASAAVDHVRPDRSESEWTAPIVGSYTQARATARKRQRAAQSA